jgi:hypothetical protein
MYRITCDFKFFNTSLAKFIDDPWVMGQVFHGSCGSWVILSDPYSQLCSTTSWFDHRSIRHVRASRRAYR